MILFLKGSTFKLPALAVVTAILAVACSPAEHHRKVLDTSFLNLGKAGEVKSASNIPEAEHLVVLSKNQTLRFMDDAGLVEIDPINKKLEPGQIIVGNESEPTLLEVIKVVSENGSNVQVQTKLAKASQLSKDNEASFSYEATPEISSEGAFETTGSIKINDDAVIELEDVEFYSFTAESKGRISKSVNVFGKLKRDHQFDVQSLDQGDFKAVIKKGKLKLIPTFRSQAQFSWGKPKKIDSQIDALLQYEFEIEFSYTGKGNFTVTTDIIPKQKIPVRIPGPVPVFVDIEMQVPAGIKFSSQAGGSLTVKYEGSYAFASKLTYDPKSGVNKVVQQDFTTDQMIVKRPENEASVSAEFFLEPKVMSRLYRVLGPYAYLHPYIKGQVLFPLKRHQDDLFMGITGGVGLQVSEPVFQSELLNLKSGSLFNVYQSWDLVAPLPVAPKAEGVEKTLANKKQEAFTVSSLTPEGFVVIHLKDKTDERLLNFRLIQGTTRGLLVPADSFASTGKVYYFPLMKDAAQAEDQFSYYISDGKTVGEPQTVKLTVSPAIIEGLKKPRFSITSNSVKMSFSGPSQNEDKVPHFRVGEELRSAYVHVNANVPPVEAILLASGLEVSKVPNAFSVSTNRQVKVDGQECKVDIIANNIKLLKVAKVSYASFKLNYLACDKIISNPLDYGLPKLTLESRQKARSIDMELRTFQEIVNKQAMDSKVPDFYFDNFYGGNGIFPGNFHLSIADQIASSNIVQNIFPEELKYDLTISALSAIVNDFFSENEFYTPVRPYKVEGINIKNPDYQLGENCCRLELDVLKQDVKATSSEEHDSSLLVPGETEKDLKP